MLTPRSGALIDLHQPALSSPCDATAPTLANPMLSAHSNRMSDGSALTVHFACHECGAAYTATQLRVPEERHGRFTCCDCGKPVHHWAGRYDFSNWQPITSKPLN